MCEKNGETNITKISTRKRNEEVRAELEKLEVIPEAPENTESPAKNKKRRAACDTALALA